ncbi:hypothetical protein M3Y99_00355900 [Aphelenchoides fujianensis]|nr:hypothetical protein M3Y99_00355900 [Aphelenchoides fujianensis]
MAVRVLPASVRSACLGLVILVGLIAAAVADDGGGPVPTFGRVKRQYDYDYGNYYGWQAGRLVGWILGFIVLLLVICVPCICCIGIIFGGWFGVRQAVARRRRGQGAPPQSTVYASNGGVIRRTMTDPPSPLEPQEHRVVYAHASDRYFERRPRTPPTAAPAAHSADYRRP